ncbi:MAG: hypothetical protein KatS3mg057_1795 [Herpetosiphonaceae bacterium]|nr:MAG: hypothetical protein KatS3mg057_1795 [Herpetosiphonaceae bacterium]
MIKRRLRAIRRPTLRRGWLRWLGLRLVWLGLAALMVYFVFNFVSTSLELSKLDAQIAEREAENAMLAAENERLKGELEYVESDAYVERAAREQLGMAREGETVIIPQVIPREPAPLLSPTPLPLQQGRGVPNWRRWIDALRGDR